ncbi:uncharacterized protein LOC128262353 [Drosophila gunungcola]|uniref:Uncharacterized protein n=1 Tax=Drosophila gunungcola TaxID=103775 RepID=A0A9P9YT00_9MUSC|nr:uncharacterized protein LOC128262353 [Drosophila gunungcola]KAI8042328.1 hypothetical protein M5D96_003631 [Drosophila gunungcola]
MTAKKTTFDLMSLGYPIHSDPYEVHFQSSSSPKLPREPVMCLKELRQKLHKEARNVMPDFFMRDPSSSSDESDDLDFPETLSERARRMSFARRRKLHYNEFATVELARRLIHDEFATLTDSLCSEDIDFIPEIAEEECHPCEHDSTDSYPYLQYDRFTTHSQISDDSLPKEDPEPGFDGKHHCFEKLMAGVVDHPAVVNIPTETEPTTTPPPPEPEVVDILVEEEEPQNHDIGKKESKHTRVADKGKNWDLRAVRTETKTIRSKNAKNRVNPRTL